MNIISKIFTKKYFIYNDSDVGYYDEYDSPILSLEELVEQEEYIFEISENTNIKNEE